MTRKLRTALRTVARTGRDNDAWPVVLLLVAVLVPALGLLWFMNAAMRNERLATRQKLADAYRGQLASAQVRLQRSWQEKALQLEEWARTLPAPLAFERSLREGGLDGVVVLSPAGVVAYPNIPGGFVNVATDAEPGWAEANRLEFLRHEFVPAAGAYASLAKGATNEHAAARALQGQTRCLVKAGQPAAAIKIITDVLEVERYRQATDAQGRLIVANAELLALELLTNHLAPQFSLVLRRLTERLNDYGNPVLAAPQRRFLMREASRLAPELVFPTLAAEELAAEFSSSTRLAETVLQRTSLPGVWFFATPQRRVWGLLRSETLARYFASALTADAPGGNVRLAILSPEIDNQAALLVGPAGEAFPGWRLALSLHDPKVLETTMEHSTALYLWSGLLGVATMGVLTLLALRLLRRQTSLARLKNDLAATVSHELKTPLSSMRVLVDTLLEAPTLDEPTVREYLRLIAQENERLSRLIQNFLTFSRIERGGHNFQLTSCRAGQLVEAAAEAARERFNVPGCRFEVRLEGILPNVRADTDAIITALLNLLDNAFKYSAEIKDIVLSARAENGEVFIAVKDNGIGIAPRERRLIFQRFYQVEQPLARHGGGCGLGLSIVQFILAAHGGRVWVESEPGLGSTFTVALPTTPPIPALRQALA